MFKENAMHQPDNAAPQMKRDRLSALRSFLYRMPKVDLHRHLEGSLRLQTLAEIAVEHGMDLPASGIEELRPYVQVTDEEPDFHSFLAKFQLLRRFYRNREAVKRVTYEAVADAASDTVRYLELRFNPVALARAQHFSLADVTEWVADAIAQAQEDHDISVRLILQIGRDEPLQIATEIIELALACRDRGVVGIDLAGDEANYPPQRFAPLFHRAWEEGLGITVHAGEAGGPENVRDSIRLLHARRIGHGVRVVEDSNVVALVRERGIVLEVCPTSNLQTGVVRSLSQHPLRKLIALGLPVTINTDDPSISDTTLTDEYMVAATAIGVELTQVRKAVVTALDAAFLPDTERRQLRQRFADWEIESLAA
jgi:adenosine deaminase